MPQQKKGGSVDLAAAAAPFILLAGKTYMESQLKGKKKAPAPKGRRRPMRGGADDVPSVSGTPTGSAPAYSGNAWSVQDNQVSNGVTPQSATGFTGMSSADASNEYSSVGGKGKKKTASKPRSRKTLRGGEFDEVLIGGFKMRGGQDVGTPTEAPIQDPNTAGEAPQQPGSVNNPMEIMAGGKRKTVRRRTVRRGGSDEEQDGGAKRKTKTVRRRKMRGGDDEEQEQEQKQDQDGGAKRKAKAKKTSGKKKLSGGALEMYSQQLQELTHSLQNLLS